MAKTYSMSDVAAEIGTTPRNVRKHWRNYVRANDGKIGEDTPGKGKTYALTHAQFVKTCKIIRSRIASENVAPVVSKPKARASVKAQAISESVADALTLDDSHDDGESVSE